MKNGKLTIFMIAVVAIGVFSLPAVMSVGLGQHTIKSESGVACDKCHSNSGDGVFTEILASGNVEVADPDSGLAPMTIGQAIHQSTAVFGGQNRCKACHDTTQAEGAGVGHTTVTQKPVCTTCHDNVAGEISATTEPHAGFSGTGNLGCLGCHSAVRVSGSPSYTYSAGDYAVGLFIGNGSARNLAPVAPIADP